MRRFVPFMLFALSAGLVLYGVSVGEAASVFRKAVTICLSCIGIG